MEYKELLATINVEQHDCSILLVDAKPLFHQKVDEYVATKGWPRLNYYALEEATAVLIPKIDRFSGSCPFGPFLEYLKVSLLEAELARLGEEAVHDFGYPVTSRTFDLFFEARVRSVLVLPSDLGIL
jgi:hypothetical protein